MHPPRHAALRENAQGLAQQGQFRHQLVQYRGETVPRRAKGDAARLLGWQPAAVALLGPDHQINGTVLQMQPPPVDQCGNSTAHQRRPLRPGRQR